MRPAAYAEVDLSALRHNLQRVREAVPGALRGADAFAVARVDEGARLRQAGITRRVAIVETERPEMPHDTDKVC